MTTINPTSVETAKTEGHNVMRKALKRTAIIVTVLAVANVIVRELEKKGY